MMLRRSYHLVTTATSGRAALDDLSDGSTGDVVLPFRDAAHHGMGRVAQEVKAWWPGVIVGLVTGLGENPDGPETERATVDFPLAKPVDGRRLVEASAAAAWSTAEA